VILPGLVRLPIRHAADHVEERIDLLMGRINSPC
jgi:hypothetical protein